MLGRYLSHRLYKKDHFMWCLWEKQCTQERKEPKVCDWNHLSLSVAVPAKPTSRRGRGLELTQSHFAAQTKTCAHDGQHATKITSALTDTWIQFPGPVTLTLVKTLCLSLVLMTIFLTACYLPFSPSFVTMSSSKPIDARRMSEWYKDFTDKDDDPHSPFSSCVSDVVVGRNRSLYQKQESIENDEAGLVMEKDDYTSSASTSSSVSSFSSWSDENEHNMWNPLLELFCHVQVGLHMETLVDEVATARVALMPFRTRPSMWQEWQLSVSSEATAVEALPLWHICGCTICVCADPFGWRTLWHTPCTAWEESHTQTICLCRQTVQKSSVDRRHADLHRFHLGLFEAPQPPIVARVPLHLMSNGANHGQFRRLSAPYWRLVVTSCKRFPHMKRRWTFMDCLQIFWVGHRTRQDWQRGWTRTTLCPHLCVSVHSSATHHYSWWTTVSLSLIFGFDLCCASKND